MSNTNHSLLQGFRDGQHRLVEDVPTFIRTWMEARTEGEIYVGADSKVRGDKAKYSTVICLWDVGKGVSELYRNEIIPKPRDGFTRLWNEVTRAVEVADQLRELGDITVHVDINESPKYRSHQLYDASIGLITSMGFKAAGKPFSWAASCGAHRHCQ